MMIPELYDISKPAFASIEISNFSRMTSLLEYVGSLNKFMQVAAVGRRSES